MTTPRVAILMGSKNDLPKIKSGLDTLKDFGVEFTARVMSAHRTPAIACGFASSAKDNGIQVFICAAGMAAHLAGVVAGHTILPVIGLPVSGGALDGLDALYATVQMPPGIPVATVGVNGSKNAALLAIQIMALSDEVLAQKLVDYKEDMAEKVIASDEALQLEI